MPLNLVLTDPDNEIDDEIFLHLLTQSRKSERWLVVCVPGNASTDPNEANQHASNRLVHLEKLFTNFVDRKLTNGHGEVREYVLPLYGLQGSIDGSSCGKHV